MKLTFFPANSIKTWKEREGEKERERERGRERETGASHPEAFRDRLKG